MYRNVWKYLQILMYECGDDAWSQRKKQSAQKAKSVKFWLFEIKLPWNSLRVCCCCLFPRCLPHPVSLDTHLPKNTFFPQTHEPIRYIADSAVKRMLMVLMLVLLLAITITDASFRFLFLLKTNRWTVEMVMCGVCQTLLVLFQRTCGNAYISVLTMIPQHAHPPTPTM